MDYYLPLQRGAWLADFLNNRQMDLKLWTRLLSIYDEGLRAIGYADDARRRKLRYVAMFLFRGEIVEEHYLYGGGDIENGVLARLLRRDAEDFYQELGRWMPDIGAAYTLQIMQGKNTLHNMQHQNMSGLDRLLRRQTQFAEEILANPNLESDMEKTEEIYHRGLLTLHANDPKLSFSTFDRDLLHVVKSALRSDPTHMVLGDRCVFRVRLSTVAEKTRGPHNCKWFLAFDMDNAAIMSIHEQLIELCAIYEVTNQYSDIRMALEEATDWLNKNNCINGREVEIVEWINGTSQHPHHPGPETMYQHVAALLRQYKAEWYRDQERSPVPREEPGVIEGDDFNVRLPYVSGRRVTRSEHEMERAIEDFAIHCYDKRIAAEKHVAEMKAEMKVRAGLPNAGVSQGNRVLKRKFAVIESIEEDKE
ncbi:hypothetical protein F5X68DRAFT_229068 [Plectosphaerella plurivora]|uniref:Uncharacterized protein n=1 Tax=Plectosphaerella plurivora TaxID=936078 RepID=A0A9P8VK85_9PEZI|nr:hypothetical protein F5X68DRAFT_229068 [Plectosphaerella plurivora]